MNNKAALLWLALPLLSGGCTTMEAQIKSSGTMGQTDADYANTAVALGELDTQAGALAATRASDPRVKSLAATLVAQAKSFAPGLQSAFAAGGITPPKALPQADAARIAALGKLNGAAFDRQYVDDELDMHKRAVAVLQKESAETKDGALRGQVLTQLPAVQGNMRTLQILSDEFHGKTHS